MAGPEVYFDESTPYARFMAAALPNGEGYIANRLSRILPFSPPKTFETAEEAVEYARGMYEEAITSQ